METEGATDVTQLYLQIESQETGLDKKLLGEGSNVGALTRLSIEIRYHYLEPLNPSIPLHLHITAAEATYIVRFTGAFYDRMSSAYAALLTDSEDPSSEGCLLAMEDLKRIINAEGVAASEVVISRYRLARAYLYDCFTQCRDFEVALVQAGLFGRFLADEIESGNNRLYLTGMDEEIPHKDERWNPELLGVRLFVKADLVAQQGMSLKRMSDRLHKGVPFSTPGWLSTFLVGFRDRARGERLSRRDEFYEFT